jgi:hypothetical protein
LVAGGVGVVYADDHGWQPAPHHSENGFTDGIVKDDERAATSQDLIAQ